MNRRALTAAGVPLVSLLVGAVVFLLGVGAGAGGGVRVLAAASLADAARAVEPDARVSPAGSDQLAVQIANGAPGDVFLSADPAIAADLHARGLVGAPVPFAGNRLVVIVPAADPAGVRTPADLTHPGVRLVIGTSTVPVGGYARRALDALGLAGARDNVVSEEPDVRGVVAKVALGEADAGIVYATDAAAAGDRVRTIAIPPAAQPRIDYAAAVLTDADDPAGARAFIARLRSGPGRDILRAHGFTVPAR